ncbi:hypothetical protein Q9R39_23620 [Gordonia sp. AC31]|nr:hypothetical protein [Gordonia sp. AC31]MDT0223949.1 hypothetical protein [Gordonia sp. AC31]
MRAAIKDPDQVLMSLVSGTDTGETENAHHPCNTLASYANTCTEAQFGVHPRRAVAPS